jgi:hypothetical protein
MLKGPRARKDERAEGHRNRRKIQISWLVHAKTILRGLPCEDQVWKNTVLGPSTQDHLKGRARKETELRGLCVWAAKIGENTPCLDRCR